MTDMRVVRIQRRTPKQAVERLQAAFLKAPGLRPLRQAHRHMQKVAVDEWPALLFTALFCHAYYNRFKRDWRGADNLIELHNAMVTLIEKEGRVALKRGIELIFSQEFQWVTTHLGSLRSEKFWTQFLVPAMARRPITKGEQSEWQGARTEAAFQQVYF